MTRPSLYFERIDIRRMPGFDTKGFSVANLSEGVNIVYGPNASGKTSLSKAIAMLLGSSTDALASVSLAAQLHENEESIAIDCSFGRITAQKEGLETEYTPYLPAQVEHRYLLALHDLLQAEDGDLAKEILREASGGFDLQTAREDLGFTSRITGTGTNVYKGLKAAQKEHREAAKSEEVLRSRERELATLEGTLANANAAQQEIDHLSRTLSCHSKMSAWEACEIRLNAFPAGVAKLLGNEADQLDSYRNDQAALERDRISIETRRNEANHVLEASPLPQGGIGQEVVMSLRGALSEIQDLDRRIETSESEVVALSAQKKQALRQLGGPEQVPESAAVFTTNTLVEIGDLAREEAKLRAEATSQDQLAAWLNTEHTSNGDPDLLNQGLKLLTQWLAKHDERPPVEERPLLPWIMGAVALGLSAVLLGLLVDPFWFLLLLAGGALIAYGRYYGRAPDKSDPLPLIKRQYEALDLEHPASWDPDHVLRLQVALQSQYGAAAINAEKKNRWDGLATKRDDLTERLKHLDEQRSQISDRLGVACPQGFPELLLTAERLTAYFNAESALFRAREQLDGFGMQRVSLQNDVTAKLIQFGCDPSGDTTLLVGLVDKLDTLRESHAAAIQAVSQLAEQASTVSDSISRLTSKIEAIFTGVGLTIGDDLTLSQWLAQRADYLSAKQQFDGATRDLAVAKTAAESRKDLMELSAVELEREVQRCTEQGSTLEETREQMMQIRTEVAHAKRQTRREEKLAQVADCENALRDQRDQDQRSLIGNVLVDFLAEKERTRDRPGVFQRARHLFTNFTNGRYSLEMDDRTGSPEFRGIDTTEGVGKPLDALSSGTRLQLLIAVRMAFLEHQERGGFKIPLLLDETLGNSDEKRADQIIETAIEICRQGRQIFYYTAQHDEVGKWERLLAQSGDVPHQVTDLAEVRQFVESERVPKRPLDLPPMQETPEPDGMDWQQYGGLLGIEDLNSVTHVGDVHLWYLIKDVDLLYDLLRNQINRWGQLENIVRNSGSSLIDANTPAYLRAQASADVIAQTIRLREIGRGKPVDRRVLEGSGAVSDRFLDEVSELAVTLDGQGAMLIEQLQNGTVKSFNRRKMEDLEAFLEESEYIDSRKVMTTEEITEDLVPRVLRYLEDGLLEDVEWRWLVGQAVG